MQIRESNGTIFIGGKVITTLDTFVASIVDIIEEYTNYVIVSGYVAILFGRARGTEDIDLLVRQIDRDTFHRLFENLTRRGYYFLNSPNEGELYSKLRDGLCVRIAKEEKIIPNIEMKFGKNSIDHYALDHRRSVEFDGMRLFTSPFELQIAYKLFLGSDKDIEDAVYLWEIFREILDRNLLQVCTGKLAVTGEPYGIGI